MGLRALFPTGLPGGLGQVRPPPGISFPRDLQACPMLHGKVFASQIHASKHLVGH